MNENLLYQRAHELAKLLHIYAPVEEDAAKLNGSVSPIIQQALDHNLLTPLAWQSVPGDLLFTEGSLGSFPDLSDAFYKFKIEATGGPPPGLQKIRERNGLDPITGDKRAIGDV